MAPRTASRFEWSGLFCAGEYIVVCWIWDGGLEYVGNDLGLAINCFKEALSTYLYHFPAMFNLATCYEKDGKLIYAIKWLKRALRLKNDYHFAYLGLSLCLFKLG